MIIKMGVDVSRLNREIWRIFKTVESIYQTLAEQEPIITSTYDGNHSLSSLHYTNDAVDFRLPTKNREEIFQQIANALGKDYDCINHVDHIHVEYDPKG